MAALYSKATSDSGTGAKTRAGHRRLNVKCTADVKGGRAEIDVEMVRNSWTGEVEMVIHRRNMPEGITVRLA